MDLAIVIVAFGGAPALGRTLDALAAQCGPGDEVVIVDNAGDAREATRAGIELIEPGANLGFARSANLGAAATSAETIVFLNPDAVPEPGCLDALRAPPDGWDAWMPLIALPDGERVNSAGNVAHFTGFGWTGRYGEPVAAVGTEPREVGFLSGACLAVRRTAWEAVGAFPGAFFMYVEDLDLSHRLRLAGRRFGLLPAARVRHDYAFDRGPEKLWRLERNRLLMVVRCYPAAVLARVVPALIATEVALLVYATADGWGVAKARATAGFLRALPRALRERRAIQGGVRISAREFAGALVAELDSPFFGRPGRARLLRTGLRAYWALVRGTLARET